MNTAPAHPFCKSLLLLLALASPQLSATQPPAPALPAWQVLEYEQQAFFMTAKSRIEISAAADNTGQWRLTANSSVASNSEEVTLDLAAADGKALYRARLSRGKNERYKTYDFLPDHVERMRRDPPPKTGLPPAEWPVSSRRSIPYPAAAAGVVVTDAYALLALAGRFQASGAETADLIVNTDLNFYRVTMTNGGAGPEVKADYRLAGNDSAVSGKHSTRSVAMTVAPVGEQPDKDDFSLLGLSGDITILFDEETGLPLQLRGAAPRIGDTEINLRGATLRKSGP